jgi:hypothetical protein
MLFGLCGNEHHCYCFIPSNHVFLRRFLLVENLGYLERLFQNRLLCPTPTNPVLLQTVERKLKIVLDFPSLSCYNKL